MSITTSARNLLAAKAWQAVIPVALLLTSFAIAKPASASWAAIATNQANNIWGGSWNYPTKAQAEARALQECGERGGTSCRVRVWSRNECIAIARSPGSSRLAWGASTSRAQAKALAISTCGNGACSVEVSDCTRKD